MNRNRRDLFKQILAMGAGVGAASAWQNQLAAKMRATRSHRKLIVLWMPGGPSQMDTFDLKPGHGNGGPFKEIQTSVPGIRISEHLPELSKLADQLCIVRSMQTKEGDHSRGTFLVRTGQRPGAPVQYPSFPAALAKELSTPDSSVPGYVSILQNSFINPTAFSAGFLGASREALTVGGTSTFDPNQPAAQNREVDSPVDLRVDNLLPPASLDRQRLSRRREFWDVLQNTYGAAQRPGAPMTHDTVYRRAMQLAESELVEAFDLQQESDAVRRGYGNDAFGQGCLLARRLIERDVPVVEVSLSDGLGGLSWDSHIDNFNIVKRLSERLDRAWSRLMEELAASGLLEQTTIAWMGEFGRTPQINSNGGRDHFPNAWTCVLAGGGIVGGSVYGKTSDDGMEVVDSPVSAPDFLATLCAAVGVAPDTENISPERRPIKLSDGNVIEKIVATPIS